MEKPVNVVTAEFMIRRWYLLFLTVVVTFAQPSPSSRSLSLDSRFFFNGYSNEAIGRFGIEMIHLGSLPASILFPHDATRRDTENVFLWYDAQQLRNVAESVVLLLGSGFFSVFVQIPFHEFGHGTRSAAAGLKPYYGFEGPVGLSGGTLYSTFFTFYLANLLRLSNAFTTATEALYLPRSGEWDRDWSAVVSMGGMNNSMFFSELIEDEMLRFGGHIGFAPTYLYGKLSAALYRFNVGTGNDKANILSY